MSRFSFLNVHQKECKTKTMARLLYMRRGTWLWLVSIYFKELINTCFLSHIDEKVSSYFILHMHTNDSEAVFGNHIVRSMKLF